MQKIVDNIRQLLPQLRSYWPHAAVLFFFCALGWLNGYMQASTLLNNPSLKDNWSVPNWTPYHAGPERIIFATADMWDGVKKASLKQAAPEELAWKFVGTVRTGKTYAAVILAPPNSVKRMVAGDVLPNGEKIVAIENGLLRIDVAGNEQEIRLFQQGKK